MTDVAYLVHKGGNQGFAKFDQSGYFDPKAAFAQAANLRDQYPGVPITVYAVPGEQLDSLMNDIRNTAGKTHRPEDCGVVVSSLKQLEQAASELFRKTNIARFSAFEDVFLPERAFA